MIEIISEFFEIEQGENFGTDLFNVLKKAIDFESGYIFFTSPKRLEYSFNPTKDIKEPFLKEDLKFKNTIFGEIIITGENFTPADKKNFKACASIIANITKDVEISKIIKMQTKALQDGCREIQESEKIKTKFLSHMSHELRTPLNSILGFSDLLGKELAGALNDRQKEFINEINVSGLNLLEMINEILDISKIEAGVIHLNLREFEITDAITEVINTIKPLLLKKNLTLTNNSKNFTITADYQKFQQILLNLLSNAIKFTPVNGQIVINAGQNADKTLISIEDSGIGIAEENHEKIFEKFEQIGESKEPSTGLGLAITKELVKLHNGEITVTNSALGGAKFVIKLFI